MDVATATTEDPVLTAVIKATKTGDWSKLRSTQPKYYKIRNDLTTALNDSILMRNRQLCLPQKLQDRALRLAHETHMGMTKTKRMLREKVYFPGITARIEEMIRCCPACQLCTDDSIRPPISSSKLPERPWQEVSCDYYTLSNNDEVLVVIDDYSRYPEVEPVTTTSGRVAINKLSNIFARFGLPETVRTDNGPPFNYAEGKGNDLDEFFKTLGIRHRRVIELWPQANGEVERFMRGLNKMVRTATADGVNWKSRLPQHLLAYRTSPHTTTGVAPATLMFNRPIQNKIAQLIEPDQQLDAVARDNDNKRKKKMKKYADERFNTANRQFAVGDRVLLRNLKEHPNKMMPLYELEPYTVTEVKGVKVTATNSKHTMTRNSCHFRPFKEGGGPAVSDDEDEEDTQPPQQPNPEGGEEEAVAQQPNHQEEPERPGPAGRPTRRRRANTRLTGYEVQLPQSLSN